MGRYRYRFFGISVDIFSSQFGICCRYFELSRYRFGIFDISLCVNAPRADPKILLPSQLLFLVLNKQPQQQHLFNFHFQDNPGKLEGLPVIGDFWWSKDDGGGGDSWSYMASKAPVESFSSTYQYRTFYRSDSFSVAQLGLWVRKFPEISGGIFPEISGKNNGTFPE